jgi:large subunit ribosomal protein L11
MGIQRITREKNNMAKESIDVLVNGGKATAAPPLGPALGPLGVNIGQVVAAINEKTKSFAGMQVPVKVTVDKDTKEFEISIGTPPASGLIKKEAGVQKGSGNPKTDMVADLKIQQILKIAQMKEDALLGKDAIQRVKEIIGTCDSMGILVEGKRAKETIKDVAAGKYDQMILSGKTELSAEEMAALAEEKKHLQEELKAHREANVKRAKDIITQNQGRENRVIRKALEDAEIPMDVINEVAPEDKDPKKK